MKVTDGLEIISKGWILKPNGYRVRFQKWVDSELTTQYSPDLDSSPLDSDVACWRYAWKLYMATKSDSDEVSEDELVNITVVDDANNEVSYYVTGRKEIYNQKKAKHDI
ncbi:MAG: hypothetical protein HOE30_12060 [Deltaproteobacteria bacterium]|jgi:hypothetical protein|nr:hypothetical protein [Deltaproteobacteria bacterium]MBT4266750.1 hypothetical protein [Deltaproteobacteria bacterium]MBT4641113.1 hypothetical protein [Deltaproteobacteria bacterium]MBT6505005.1 hypothetical protein [Deltaproteobacteria bacterium]MBT6615527.1 hypothetical protein [Deltaproteobacteria bacterium]